MGRAAMDLSDTPLFALADRRLAWVESRQTVLAQNIANADTPHWRAQDVQPFAASLQQATVTLARTDPGHLAPATGPGSVFGAGALVSEQSPDGNSVAIDKELVKVADTDAVHELVTNLSKKYLGLVRTAIGR
jgi:flagellar basal-body rod protein FlgB